MVKIRLDKFLWCVRLAKTRKAAVDMIGKVKINRTSVKASKEISINDIVFIQKNTAVFQYKVLALTSKRIGAKLVEEFIQNITPKEEMEKFELFQANKKLHDRNGRGKPSTKDRREIKSFYEGE